MKLDDMLEAAQRCRSHDLNCSECPYYDAQAGGILSCADALIGDMADALKMQRDQIRMMQTAGRAD